MTQESETKETTVKGNELQPISNQSGALASLAPKTLEEALKFCDFLATSTVIPKDFVGKPANIFVAVQWGMELGLQPLQAMQNIAVINGRPTLWGDAMLALVMASPVFGSIEESIEGEGDAAKAICRVSRKGGKVHEQTFSVADARTAGLLGKDGPWKNYRHRMMQMRARSWALRDTFPDVLKGMPCAEEVADYELEPGSGYQVVSGKGKPEVIQPKAISTATQSTEKTSAESEQEAGESMIKPAGIAVLKRSLDAKNINHDEFLKHLKVEKFEDLTLSRFNDAMNDAKRWESQP